MSFIKTIFFIFLFEIKLFFSQKIINYEIFPTEIDEEECDKDNKKFKFVIKGKIEPSPIYDLNFELNLNSPIISKAQCRLIDDVDDKIKCSINIEETHLQKVNVELMQPQIIKDGTVSIRINEIKDNNGRLTNITCDAKNLLLIRNKSNKGLWLFLALFIILLY